MRRATVRGLSIGTSRISPRPALPRCYLYYRQVAKASTTSNTGTKSLLTLAIETSCDDTCVAVLEKRGNAAKLLFNEKITSDNREFGGVEPITTIRSRMLALIVDESDKTKELIHLL